LRIFRKSVEKISSFIKFGQNKFTLREERDKFVIISHTVLL